MMKYLWSYDDKRAEKGNKNDFRFLSHHSATEFPSQVQDHVDPDFVVAHDDINFYLQRDNRPHLLPEWKLKLAENFAKLKIC